MKEQELHINALELMAVFLAIQTFVKGKEHQHILVKTDNMATSIMLGGLTLQLSMQ